MIDLDVSVDDLAWALTRNRPPSWRDRAECKDTPVDMFFSINEQDELAAIGLCRQCPVRVECITSESLDGWHITSVDGTRGLRLRDRRALTKYMRTHNRTTNSLQLEEVEQFDIGRTRGRPPYQHPQLPLSVT